jgi:flavodoxin
VKAVVVYESHWGNTAAIARAIADGLGSGAQALSTQEASSTALADADLLVAGARVHRLPASFGHVSGEHRGQPGRLAAGRLQ